MKKKSNPAEGAMGNFSNKFTNSILKISNHNKLIFFYEDCVIILYTSRIYKYNYNKISYVKENNDSFFISFRTDNIRIKKKLLNEKTLQFLRKIINNYKSMNIINGQGRKIWESLNLNNNSVFSCISEINSNSIKEYYSIGRVRFDIFLYYYYLHLIRGIIFAILIWVMLYILSYLGIKHLIYFLIIVPGVLFSCELLRMDKYLEVNESENLKLKNSIEIFFYNDIFIMKSQDIIAIDEYKILKIIYEDNNLIIVKPKLLQMLFNSKAIVYPLIIDKKKLNKNDVKFIYDYLKK